MATALTTPDRAGLEEALEALAGWQASGEPLQLHPGDLAWYCRLGARATADAVRTWRMHGRPVAIGLLDGPGLLRVTTAPGLRQDAALAEAMVEDIARPKRGVLPAGAAAVEVPTGAALGRALTEAGWRTGAAWTPLERDLGDEVEAPTGSLRIVPVDGGDPELVAGWTAVQRSAFDTPRSTDERWRAMAAGPWAPHAVCLLGLEGGEPAAGIIAWSAGAGRPGLIEPLGVHRDHRRRGHARAITLAAAAALREPGASSAQVCTESERVGAVAAYRSAGFAPMPERFDLERAA